MSFVPSNIARPQLLILLCAVAACSSGQETALATRSSLVQRVAPLPDVWKPGISPEEEEATLQLRYPGKVVRNANLLALELADGRFLWLPDLWGNARLDIAGFGCCEFYRASDYWEDTGTYVGRFTHGESNDGFIVSRSTGRYAEIVAPPLRNPFDPSIFVSFESNAMESGLEVWERHGADWQRTYRCNVVQEFATGIVWTSRTTARTIPEYESVEPSLLRRLPGGWLFDGCRSGEERKETHHEGRRLPDTIESPAVRGFWAHWKDVSDMDAVEASAAWGYIDVTRHANALVLSLESRAVVILVDVERVDGMPASGRRGLLRDLSTARGAARCRTLRRREALAGRSGDLVRLDEGWTYSACGRALRSVD